MKKIIIEQTISINKVNPLSYYVVVKTKDGTLLNYNSNRELINVVGGESYEAETFEELIGDGAEAYQFDSSYGAKNWIKENL